MACNLLHLTLRTFGRTLLQSPAWDDPYVGTYRECGEKILVLMWWCFAVSCCPAGHDDASLQLQHNGEGEDMGGAHRLHSVRDGSLTMSFVYRPRWKLIPSGRFCFSWHMGWGRGRPLLPHPCSKRTQKASLLNCNYSKCPTLPCLRIIFFESDQNCVA